MPGNDEKKRRSVWSITSFVRQYMDRVRVIGPGPVKKEVEDALRENFEQYFQEVQEIDE